MVRWNGSKAGNSADVVVAEVPEQAGVAVAAVQFADEFDGDDPAACSRGWKPRRRRWARSGAFNSPSTRQNTRSRSSCRVMAVPPDKLVRLPLILAAAASP